GGEPIALFSTIWSDENNVEHQGGSLGVRTGLLIDAETRTNLGPGLLNAPHRYRIDWLADRVAYYVDGVLAATHMVAVSGPMRAVAASDYDVMSGNIVVDWVRSAPYASS